MLFLIRSSCRDYIIIYEKQGVTILWFSSNILIKKLASTGSKSSVYDIFIFKECRKFSNIFYVNSLNYMFYKQIKPVMPGDNEDFIGIRIIQAWLTVNFFIFPENDQDTIYLKPESTAKKLNCIVNLWKFLLLLALSLISSFHTSSPLEYNSLYWQNLPIIFLYHFEWVHLVKFHKNLHANIYIFYVWSSSESN